MHDDECDAGRVLSSRLPASDFVRSGISDAKSGGTVGHSSSDPSSARR